MAALWPVFGLLVLTIEWIVLRRVAPRLSGRSVAFRALIGALAGLGMSVAIVAVGFLIAGIATVLSLEGDAQQVAATAFLAMYLTGFLFSPVAAIFGAILLAVERYRVETPTDESA
jgi:hypothetical protein